MFLRCKVRRKDGKQHRSWSVVENTRVAGGRVVQRHVLYLGEINDSQELAWRRSIEVLEDGAARPRTLSLFPEDRVEGPLADAIPGRDPGIVGVRLSELRLRRPRQWGGCWLALMLWRELQLEQFWSKRLGVSRKGTHWGQVLFVLVAYRLLAPGSEWRLHREWFQRSALADLLGADAGLVEIHKLYRCHDRLLAHKQAVFDHLVGRWRDLFNIRYDVLLYDLTSTRAAITPSACGSSVFWRPARRSRERPGSLRSTITRCAGTGGTTFRLKPGPPMSREPVRAKTSSRRSSRTSLWGCLIITGSSEARSRRA